MYCCVHRLIHITNIYCAQFMPGIFMSFYYISIKGAANTSKQFNGFNVQWFQHTEHLYKQQEADSVSKEIHLGYTKSFEI